LSTSVLPSDQIAPRPEGAETFHRKMEIGADELTEFARHYWVCGG